MTIPEIRALMHELANNAAVIPPEELAAKLRWLAEATRRRRPVRQAAPRHRITAEKLDEVRRIAAANPSLGYHEIGMLANVNQGRVSEALAGKRE